MVTDGRTLRSLAKAGFIVWKPGRERHWTGQIIPVVNVRVGPNLENWYDTFVHRGVAYRLHYVDGCFYPFVFRADKHPPAFI